MVAKIAQFRYFSRNIADNSDIVIEIRSYIPILLTWGATRCTRKYYDLSISNPFVQN